MFVDATIWLIAVRGLGLEQRETLVSRPAGSYTSAYGIFVSPIRNKMADNENEAERNIHRK